MFKATHLILQYVVELMLLCSFTMPPLSQSGNELANSHHMAWCHDYSFATYSLLCLVTVSAEFEHISYTRLSFSGIDTG